MEAALQGHWIDMSHSLQRASSLCAAGYMIVERSSSSPMIYGARKSFFLVDAKSEIVSLYALCVELSSKDGKNVDKMNEVLGCLKSATAELKAK